MKDTGGWRSGRGVNGPAVAWLVAGVAGYIVIEGILTSQLNDLLPAGGWRELNVPPAMFIPIEIAALLVACAALAGLAAAASALLLWRGYALSGDLPVKFSHLGARLFVASWPFETAFLFVRGNHVPGSPSGLTTTLVAAALLALEGVVLWQVGRARRDYRGAASRRDDAAGEDAEEGSDGAAGEAR